MKRGDMTDGIFLMHIVDALKETVAFTEQQTLESFLDSTLLIRGVTASFEIAGEATKNLTQDFRDAHPEIKWRDMAGFRDVLIHGYFGIEASRLWQGAKEFAPATIAAIEKLDEYRQAREEDAKL